MGVPAALHGATYGELAIHLIISYGVIPLGLYRNQHRRSWCNQHKLKHMVISNFCIIVNENPKPELKETIGLGADCWAMVKTALLLEHVCSRHQARN